MFKKRAPKSKPNHQLSLENINSNPTTPPQESLKDQTESNHDQNQASLLPYNNLPQKSLKSTSTSNPHTTTVPNQSFIQQTEDLEESQQFKAGYSSQNEHLRLQNLEKEVEDPRDALRRQVQISEDIKSGKLDPKVYRGQKGYAIYNVKNENDIANSKWTGSIGPIKTQTHFKFSAKMDYNPSLCKDFHDTGYCVFGDSCIYQHDRGDYKAGWELEKDFEEKQRKKQFKAIKRLEKAARGEAEGSESDDSSCIEDYEDEGNYGEIDEKCQLCGENYTTPVVTRCGHIFCEGCALKNYRSTKKCFKCRKDTNGVFNEGKDILKRALEEKVVLKKRKKDRKYMKQDYGPVSDYLMDLKKDDFGRGKAIDDAEIDGAIVVPEEELGKFY